MSALEIIATLLGLANIFLIIRRSIWNYPFGIVMVAIYAVIFRDAKLYSDAGLQIFFLLIQIYGWFSWSRNKADVGEIVVETLGRIGRFAWISGAVLACAGWGYFMMRVTDASFPFWDGSIAMLSVTAQILMTRRYLENWIFWIVVDCLAIPLFAAKGLYLTSGLYCVFLALAITGLLQWRRAAARA